MGYNPIKQLMGSRSVTERVTGTTDKDKEAKSAGEAAKREKIAADAKELSDKYTGERNKSRDALQALSKENIPQVSATQLDPFWADRQKILAEDLGARARGEGQSLAQQQFQQSSNTALQKSLGAIRAATGANPALAGRTAALATSNLMGNLAAESGMARLREQQQSQEALAAVLSQGQRGSLDARNQDIGVSAENARLAAGNQTLRAGIESGLSRGTEDFYQAVYNRGLQGQIGRPQTKDNTLGTIATVGGAIAGGFATGGTPQGVAAGAAAGKGIGDSLSLREVEPDTKKKSYALNPRRGR